MHELINFVCIAIIFGIGYLIGDVYGWSRCWQQLTKDESWRKEKL